jgi:hypothetical protein
MGELLCLHRPLAPAEPVITKKITAAKKVKLLYDYEDHLTS